MLILFATLFVANACIAGTIPATPENITVTFLTPTTVRVSWQTRINLSSHSIEKYIVTYKPTDDRVVQDVAGNSEAIILDRLSPSTQYSIAVTAIWLGKKYRSRQIIFRTLDMPRPLSQQDLNGNGNGNGHGNTALDSMTTMNRTNHNGSLLLENDFSSTSANSPRHRELPPIRGVEVGIVLVVLMVWAGAIALFFNRWGKIRMLLPYQPDYKHEQLKVPGTGVCTGGVCAGQHSHQFEGSDCGGLAYQPKHRNSRHFHLLQEEPLSTVIAERCTRSRINSAIFVSSEGKGFDSIEFLRRHGSQSVLCRKAKSAENISEDERKRKSFSEKSQWCCSNDEDNDVNGGTIELTYCQPKFGNELIRTNRSAAIKTSNMIVGSVSIETPPSHIKDELIRQQSVTSNTATRQMSNDSSENEMISNKRSQSPLQQHQQQQQPAFNSPKRLNLKTIQTTIISLPMVSVSEPSPPNEDDCL